MKKILLSCMLFLLAILASAQLTYDFNETTGVLVIDGDGTIITNEDVRAKIAHLSTVILTSLPAEILIFGVQAGLVAK